jgi:hypothetical protein
MLGARRLREFAVSHLRIQSVKVSTDFLFVDSFIPAVPVHGWKLYFIFYSIGEEILKRQENHDEGFVLQKVLFTI